MVQVHIRHAVYDRRRIGAFLSAVGVREPRRRNCASRKRIIFAMKPNESINTTVSEIALYRT